MKYTIVINQLGLKDDKEISLTEASVIGWIHDFCGSNNKKINKNKVDGWTLVRGQYLIDDMPLLRIKSRSGGTRLLKRLEALGYIELKSEPRKIWLKPTEKMDKLWFELGASEEQDEASETQLGASKQQTWCSQATYPNTNTNTDNNTNQLVEAIKEDKADTSIKLPIHRGKTSHQRVDSIYSDLFYNKYGFKPPYALIGQRLKVFKEVLEGYTETQVARLLITFFEWRGMTGDSDWEEKKIVSSAHSIYIFKSNLPSYEAHIRNVQEQSKEFENDSELLSIVGKYIINLNK